MNDAAAIANFFAQPQGGAAAAMGVLKKEFAPVSQPTRAKPVVRTIGVDL